MTSITTSDVGFIMGIVGIISAVFSVWKSIHKPQEEMETNQALAKKDLDNKASVLAQKELETKALVLAEQVKSKNEETERRFNDMGVRLDTAMTTAQNHIHSVDVKVDTLITAMNIMSSEVVKLGTIIEERNPKK